MNNQHSPDPKGVLLAFFAAMDGWEQAAIQRSDKFVPTTDSEIVAFREREAEIRRKAMVPFCTDECISRVGLVSMRCSPSQYGLAGGHVVDCEVKGNKATIITEGKNNFPESKDRYIFLLVLEDDGWKINGKKEVSESGRQRKVELF